MLKLADLQRRKVPTILGLVLLVLGVAVGVILVQQNQIFKLRASPQETPREVRITNIASQSFSVSWLTDEPTLGSVAFGTDPGNLSLRENDDKSPLEKVALHHVTLEGLSPDTRYFFKVGSGRALFDDEGRPYEVTTEPTFLGETETLDIVFGTVRQSSGAPAAGVLVYVTVGSSVFSGVAGNDGSYTLPVTKIGEDEEIRLFVQGSAGTFASASILAGAAKPVPQITLGETYDFTDLKPAKSAGEIPGSSLKLPQEATPAGTKESGFGLEDLGPPATPSGEVKVTSVAEKETVSTSRPQFSGSGPAGQTLTFEVDSETVFTGEVTVGQDGRWFWTPPGNLTPGEHTMTISWEEDSQTKTLTRSFTVLAAGASELPAFSATPSGATPTPTPTQEPRAALPSTEEGVPTSGNLTPTLGLFIMGVVLLILGFSLPKIIKI